MATLGFIQQNYTKGAAMTFGLHIVFGLQTSIARMEDHNVPVCNLCTMNMNKTDRRPFACQYCNSECCMKCIQAYTVTQATSYNRKPRCFDPSCNKEFADDFVETAIGRAGLRRLREGLLDNEMRAGLPQMQGLASCYKLVKQGLSHYASDPAGFVAQTKRDIGAYNVRCHIYRAAIDHLSMQRPSFTTSWSRQLDTAPGGISAVSNLTTYAQMSTCKRYPLKTLYRHAPKQVSMELEKMRGKLSSTTHSVLSTYVTTVSGEAAEEKENQLNREHAVLQSRHSHAVAAVNKMRGVLKVVMHPSLKSKHILSAARSILRQSPAISAPYDASRHSFRCSRRDCAGFVVSGNCGMCDTEFCLRCETAVAKGGGHQCSNDDLESVREVKESTKQCPWQGCGVRIQRSEGCTHMWCTKCNRAFDYSSGKPIYGSIENPHYAEYRHAAEAQAEAQANAQSARRDLLELPSHAPEEMQTALRLINNFLDVTQPKAEATFTASQLRNREIIACFYLNNEIDDAQFKARCFNFDKDRRFYHEQMKMVQTACYCALDCIDASNATVHMNGLRTHFNDALQGLAMRYNRTVYTILENWAISKQGGGKRGHQHRCDDGEDGDGDEEAENST